MGQLRRRLGLAPDGDPLAPLAALGIPNADRARLAALLHDVEREMPALYAALPQQLIHSDYDPGNVLMEGTRVTAILDFEFAGPDLRVAELAAPLTWWPAHFLGTGREWDVIAAFGRGYASVLPPTPTELDAIPALLRLRAIGTCCIGSPAISRDSVARSPSSPASPMRWSAMPGSPPTAIICSM